MQIVYQGEIYLNQRHGGISRYFDKLISHLPNSATPILTSVRSRTQHAGITNPKLRLFTMRQFRPQPLFSLTEKAHVQAVTHLVRASLFHPTYYSFLARKNIWPPCPVILTVYDMIDELLPHMADVTGWTAAAKKAVIPKADAIICISENTRKDLMNFFPGIPRDRLFVIPLAADIKPPAINLARVPGDRPYFVFVGGRGAYKNFLRLLEAFALLVKTHADIQLRVVGSNFNVQEMEKISTLGISENILNCAQTSDADLALLYRDSIALVYPSLYEGFGIPLLEAMACGTAVVTSNAASLPEVAADAALYFDPLSVEDIFSKLLQVTEDSSLRCSLVAKGAIRAKEFSWSRTSNQTLEVYRQFAR